MSDYRLERWEGAKEFHISGMKMGEIDPAAPMLKYIADKLGLGFDGRVWLAWLYSTCYSAPTAFYMITKIPKKTDIALGEMRSWWKEHKYKLHFETDRIYVKNRDEFPKMFFSYIKYTAGGEYETFYRNKRETNSETYSRIYNGALEGLYYFSRYSVFMFLETVYNLTGFPMLPTGLNLSRARTSRNGLCYALNKEEWVRKKGEAAMLNREQYQYLQQNLRRLYTELRTEHPEVNTTYWNLETSLCAYYKLFKPTRYCGYYIDRQMTEIEKMQKNDPYGADWSVLWDFRKTYFNHKALGEYVGYKGIRKKQMGYFLKTGKFTEEPMPCCEYC